MRIAVTYENGQIFAHFGHTKQFKLYDVDGGKIVSCELVDMSGSGHGALGKMLHALGVDVVICGRIGSGAQAVLAEVGIKLYGGVSGETDNAVNLFLENKLQYNPNVTCDHHDHNHEEGHSCGAHGCGSHGCGKH